jgi:hypothetical protein
VQLIAIGKEYGVDLDHPPPVFGGAVDVEWATEDLFTKLHAKLGPIVLLVDEYDSPITKCLEMKTEAMNALLLQNLEVLQSFFSVCKANGDLFRFQFATGVSTFVKAGVFSGVNHLTPITLNPTFSSLLGFTWADIERTFGPHLVELGKACGLAPSELQTMITKWYNGYSWGGEETVFNPYSVCRYVLCGLLLLLLLLLFLLLFFDCFVLRIRYRCIPCVDDLNAPFFVSITLCLAASCPNSSSSPSGWRRARLAGCCAPSRTPMPSPALSGTAKSSRGANFKKSSSTPWAKPASIPPP